MVNPYQPGYPAAPPPPGPAWGAPPNFAGAQPFPRTRPPGGGRAAVDIVAGIALAVAAVAGTAQSLWAQFGSGHHYGFWRYGSGISMIVFWVCAAFALVGGILVMVKGAGNSRIRTVAALGAGALFITFAQQIAAVCASSYIELSDDGNWLAIPTTIAVLVAAGTLIAGQSDTSAPTWPANPPGNQFPPAYPGYSPGYAAGAPFAPVSPGPAPYWQQPGVAVPPAGYAAPGYPAGAPVAPAYPAAPAQPQGMPAAPPAGLVPAEAAPSPPFPPPSPDAPHTGPDAQPTVALGDK